jgi:heme ABC exporter ATP-binding subunit CcmA
MIDARNLHKTYDARPILDGATFEVEAGEVAALVGANGSGKTTTLHVLAGLVAPDAGTARIGGVDVVERRRAAQHRLAFLPQDVRFHEALTPRQVLGFYAGVRDRPDAPVGDLLAEVDLDGAADRPCGALSGGMRQRLGLAVVWLAEAPVLLLDEPGLSLDPTWRSYLKDALRRRADDGAAVLLATHLTDVWADVVDTTLTCEDGAIRREAPHRASVRA